MKINILENKMAQFLICEAIGSDHTLIDKIVNNLDKDGLYDVKIIVNDIELNSKSFIENLERSYHENVKYEAKNIIDKKYGNLLTSICDIQETLESHKNLFNINE